MKKTLFYLASICMVLTFAACSSDDGGTNPPPPSITNKSIVNEALSLTFGNSAPIKEIIFTETGRVILGPFKISTSGKQTQGDEFHVYMTGTYKVNGNTYTAYDENGAVYCTLAIENRSSSQAQVKLRIQNTPEFNGAATIRENMATDEITTTLCREWVVTTSRLRHRSGVTAVKQFEDPAEAASMNAILEYAKSVASINESFETDMSITSIEFVGDGTLCIFFKNGHHYIGKWRWVDKNKGAIEYSWNSENMGNRFEDGTATFDIRKFQRVNYYTFTFSAEIDSSQKYHTELSFYLNEK